MAARTARSGQEPAPGHHSATARRAPVAGAPTAPATGTPAPSVPSAPAGHRRAHRHQRAHETARPVPYGITCQPTALQLGLGQRLCQMTSQDTLLFTFTNVSAAGCDLRGYPGVTLLNAGGRPMPFRIHWGTTDQMLTKTPRVLVPLAPGAVAYFAVSKWLCFVHSYSAGRSATAGRAIPGTSWG